MKVHRMKRALRVAPLALGGLVLLTGVPAQAGLLDALFGSGTPAASAPEPEHGRRSWTLHEFTTIRLVPREAGAAPNQHPAIVNTETLRQQLAQVRHQVRKDVTEPLFAADELAELVEPLAQALATAGPNDDLLLLSSSRRGAGILAQPFAVTARLFVQGGALQLVVNDARYEFMNQYLGSRVPPTFTFGSRGRAGTAALRSASASAQRSDWLALPMAVLAATPGAAVAAPAAPAAVAPAAAPTAAPAPASPAPAAAPARPRDAAFADEIEQRLTTLKRLRDKGLISEEEYQQKRKEILQLL